MGSTVAVAAEPNHPPGFRDSVGWILSVERERTTRCDSVVSDGSKRSRPKNKLSKNQSPAVLFFGWRGAAKRKTGGDSRKTGVWAGETSQK